MSERIEGANAIPHAQSSFPSLANQSWLSPMKAQHTCYVGFRPSSAHLMFHLASGGIVERSHGTTLPVTRADHARTATTAAFAAMAPTSPANNLCCFRMSVATSLCSNWMRSSSALGITWIETKDVDRVDGAFGPPQKRTSVYHGHPPD